LKCYIMKKSKEERFNEFSGSSKKERIQKAKKFSKKFRVENGKDFKLKVVQRIYRAVFKIFYFT
ncbi:MAG: hypothetical protein REI96_18580, partial [Flavobacterium nitrogenifigens]|uniref:hypothetical protein n=1 Tax=Flavobacterium nitrogenifigens TaxID=1617283 RepID=UPI002808E94F